MNVDMGIIAYLLAYNRYRNFLGIGVVLASAFFLSHKRSAINYRFVGIGLLLQFLIGFCVLRTSVGGCLIMSLVASIDRLYQCAGEGSRFLFGNLLDASGPWGFIFGLKVLPIIVFFSALTALLFHFGIIQRVVGGINYFLQPLTGTSGPETVCAIANSFLGQTEAPLLIRHYLKNMTTSELFVVMASGMATISGAILVVFVAMGVPATHLLASCAMSVPGALVIAKIIYPENEPGISTTETSVHMTSDNNEHSFFDAIAQGTGEGMQVAFIIGAMLLVFISFMSGINSMLCGVMRFIGYNECVLTIEKIVGYLCVPWGYLLGFSAQDALQAGELIGIKIAVNEVVAYSNLVKMALSERSTAIMTYALCGFSNFSCIGIQIGGIGVLAPEKRPLIAKLGVYAVCAGALTNLLSAMIAGLLI